MTSDQNATSIADLCDRPVPQMQSKADIQHVPPPQYEQLRDQAHNNAFEEQQRALLLQQQQQQQQHQDLASEQYGSLHYAPPSFWSENKYAVLVAALVFVALYILLPRGMQSIPGLMTQHKATTALTLSGLVAYSFQTLAKYL